MKGLGMLLFAGCGLGALVGLLLGMSVSPVVSAVLGSLLPFAIGYATWFSRKRHSQDGAHTSAIVYAAVVGVFAWAAAGGTCLGVKIRTHGWLSPSIAEQMKAWTDAGFEPEEAKRMVARGVLSPSSNSAPNRTGSSPSSPPVPTPPSVVDFRESVLMNSLSQNSIRALKPLIGNATLPKLKAAFVNEDDDLKKAVEYVDRYKLAEDQQRIFLENYFSMLASAPDYE